MSHWIRDYPELHRVFQLLWTKAVGTEGYDKSEWKKLALLLDQALLEKQIADKLR